MKWLIVFLIPLVSAAQTNDHLAQYLPDLSGIPLDDESSAQKISQEVANVKGGDEADCAKVDRRLRTMLFRHYENLQTVARNRKKYLTLDEAKKAAHITNMILHESSGNPCNLTDMKGREVNTYKPTADLKCWENLFTHKNLDYNCGTNAGLSQQSCDRAEVNLAVNKIVADHLPSGMPKNVKAGTFELFRIYQGFAQGRLNSSDQPIPEAARKNPMNTERAKRGLRKALWHCGTRYLYDEGYKGAEGQVALESAIDKIAYCSIGSGTGKLSADQQRCFVRWVTLCPALNVDIGALNPLEYYATRKVQPICTKTFQQMTILEPKTQTVELPEGFMQ